MSSVCGELVGRRHEARSTRLSPPTVVDDDRAEQLQRVRERLAVARLGALAHHRRRQAGEAALVRRLELIRAAEEGDRERDERQVVLLGHDQLGAVGERRSSSRSARAAPAACPAAGSSSRSSGLPRADAGVVADEHGSRGRRQRRSDAGDESLIAASPPSPVTVDLLALAGFAA